MIIKLIMMMVVVVIFKVVSRKQCEKTVQFCWYIVIPA